MSIMDSDLSLVPMIIAIVVVIGSMVFFKYKDGAVEDKQDEVLSEILDYIYSKEKVVHELKGNSYSIDSCDDFTDCFKIESKDGTVGVEVDKLQITGVSLTEDLIINLPSLTEDEILLLKIHNKYNLYYNSIELEQNKN